MNASALEPLIPLLTRICNKASCRTHSTDSQPLTSVRIAQSTYGCESLLWLAGSSDGIEVFPVLSQRFGTFLRKFIGGIADFALEGPFDF